MTVRSTKSNLITAKEIDEEAYDDEEQKNVDQNDEDYNEDDRNIELDYLSEVSITKTLVDNY